MEKEQLLNLLDKYKRNALTETERQQLENWYDSLQMPEFISDQNPLENDALVNQMLNEFKQKLKQKRVPASVVRLNTFQRMIRVAAVLIGLCLLGYTYVLLSRRPKQDTATVETASVKNDVAPPHSNKALLTLADGSQIELDSAGTGLLAVQGNINIIKQDNGQIAYSGTSGVAISYNTISLPRGSRPFKILLADGSVVWLNVASSITFPTAFVGTERRVKITGEAYFEVAKNPARPFHVSYQDMDVKVLGTHFNVNCYDDEKNRKVTLLEGAVSVSMGHKNDLLKPGQQAQVDQQSIKVADGVNLESVMAWKNGNFYFDGSDIGSIMRQVEKWYDVEVKFQSDIKSSFVARISRNENLSELLKVLELTNLVHFKIEGKTITVMK